LAVGLVWANTGAAVSSNRSKVKGLHGHGVAGVGGLVGHILHRVLEAAGAVHPRAVAGVGEGLELLQVLVDGLDGHGVAECA